MKNPVVGAISVLAKNEASELEAYKILVHSMFSADFNANDYFMYACAWGVQISEEDFYWIVKHIQKHPKEGMNACMAYIQNHEPIEPHISDKFSTAIAELVNRNQVVFSDFDYGENYNSSGPYRKLNLD